MPSGTPGKGYLSKAALRLIGYNNGAFTYPTALGTPTPETLSYFDLVPFISEGVQEQHGFLDDATLDGTAGRSQLPNISKLSRGSLDLHGHYMGLDQLLAACMGYERVRSASILESPSVVGALDSGTATGSGGAYLDDSGKSWTSNVFTNAFVRVEELAASANAKIDIRRISSNTSTRLSVSPAWTTNPASGDSYSIGVAWLHTFHMAENLHSEPITNIITSEDAWNNSAYIVRLVCVGIDKGVAVWEWQACAVEEILFKLNKDGLFITAELIPFGVDRRTSSRNASSSSWAYHLNSSNSYAYNSQYLKNFKVLRGDATFRIDSYSTSSSLDSADNIGISEFELRIKNNLQSDLQTTATGAYIAEPVRSGRREVSGSFTVPRHVSASLFTNYANDTTYMAELRFAKTNAIYAAFDAKLNIYMRSLKLTKADLSVSGPQVLEEKINFTCFQPAGVSSGMPTPPEGAANSEVAIEVQNANPFNYFMGQHKVTGF